MISYVTVGAEVGYANYGSRGVVSSGFSRVIKINKWGHIKLENGREFDKLGNARNEKYSRVCLVEPSSLRQQLADQAARRDRVQTVRSMISKLEGSFTYAGSVHVSPELRQELLELVNKL
jgi:hypothetical protein